MLPLVKCKKAFLCFFVMSMAFMACKKNTPAPPPTPPPPPPSNLKYISAFEFTKATNAAYLIADVPSNFRVDTIRCTVPAGTDITALKPTLSFTGKSIAPGSGEVQNFSSPVTYTVTAANGTTTKYTVIVKFRSTVFMPCLNGNLYALDAVTGKTVWVLANGKFDAGVPSLYKGVIYINTRQAFYAVDARTGEQKWEFPTPNTGYAGELVAAGVVAGDVVYTGSLDGYMYALNAADGSLKWKTKSKTGDPFSSSVTLGNGIVYVSCKDASFYAFDAASGNILWTFAASHWGYNNPLMVNNNVCFGTYAGNGYLLNGTTGDLIWSSTGGGSYASATLVGDRIYNGGGNGGYALDINTGMPVYVSPGNTNYEEWASPVIKDGNFYGASQDGKVYAYSIASGNLLWRFTSDEGSSIVSSLVLSEGVFYFGNNFNNIYAISASTGAKLWSLPTAGTVYGSACVADQDGNVHYPNNSGEQN